jgi:beta-carotene hydroxylase
MIAEHTESQMPEMPSELYEPSLFSSMCLVFYAISLFLVPALSCRFIWTSIDSLILRVLLLVPLTIAAGFGLQVLGIVGHEGIHMSLCKSKTLGLVIGLFLTSSILTYVEMGLAIRHWDHHRFTNQINDPDIQLVSDLKTWWQRLIFTRAVANSTYIKITLDVALGKPWPCVCRLPLDLQVVRALCWANFVFAFFWLSTYITIACYDPLTGVMCIILPMFALAFVNTFQTYVDHAGTISDDSFHNAWSRTSPLMTVIYCGLNYHLEHHLYPGIPCYRLPKVHRILDHSGFYAKVKPTIEPGFFSSYSKISAKYEPFENSYGLDPISMNNN